MGMYDTLTVADDAPIDNEICKRDWQCHQENVGATFRVNSEGELEAKGITLKEGVEIEEDEYPTPDQLKSEWRMMEDYNGPFHLNGKRHKAVLMVWDGVVKETKFNEINFEELRRDIEA